MLEWNQLWYNILHSLGPSYPPVIQQGWKNHFLFAMVVSKIKIKQQYTFMILLLLSLTHKKSLKAFSFQRVPEKKTLATPEPTFPPSALFRAAWPSLTSGWGRSGPEMVRSRLRGPFPFFFPFCFYFGIKIGRATTTLFFFNLPSHLTIVRSGLSRGRLVGIFGWFELPTFSLYFVGKIWPFQWTTRSSPVVDVRWATGLWCLPARVSINYPNLWVDYSKPFLKGPCHTRIE